MAQAFLTNLRQSESKVVREQSVNKEALSKSTEALRPKEYPLYGNHQRGDNYAADATQGQIQVVCSACRKRQ